MPVTPRGSLEAVSVGLAAEVAKRIALRSGEFAVVGLARSGRAAALLLRRAGLKVYASDATRNEATLATAAELERAGASVSVGSHDLSRIARATVMIVSPGVRLNPRNA